MSIGYYIVTVDILISWFTNCYGLTIFPLVYRRNTSFLSFPLPIDQETFMTVWLFSYFYLLLINTVVIALRILRMVYTCKSMRMSTWNQSVHSLFFETIYSLKMVYFVCHCNWVSSLIFHCISLKFKFILRTASKFHIATTNGSIFISFYLSTVEGSSQTNLLNGGYRSIGYEGKDRSKSYFRLIFILFCCFEKMVSLSWRITSLMWGIRHTRNVRLITSPIWIVGPTKKWG